MDLITQQNWTKNYSKQDPLAIVSYFGAKDRGRDQRKFGRTFWTWIQNLTRANNWSNGFILTILFRKHMVSAATQRQIGMKESQKIEKESKLFVH